MRPLLPFQLFSFLAFQHFSHASGYSTGFGVEYNHHAQLAGQGGWAIDDPTPNLSFFVDLNRDIAGALGGYYDAPSGSMVKLSHPIGMPLAGSSFSVDVALIGSTLDYPGRDSMAWCVAGPGGTNLLTIGLEPALNDVNLYNITWSTGLGIPVSTGWAIYAHSPYTLHVSFDTANALGVPFRVTVTGSNAFHFDGLVPALTAPAWEAVEAHFSVRGLVAGDNYMAFDDIFAVPPPDFDADGDGYSGELETWFGTSDASLDSTPAPILVWTEDGPAVRFPSVPGNAYLIDSSTDLVTWVTATVTASAATTDWPDPAGSAPGRSTYRVRKP